MTFSLRRAGVAVGEWTAGASIFWAGLNCALRMGETAGRREAGGRIAAAAFIVAGAVLLALSP